MGMHKYVFHGTPNLLEIKLFLNNKESLINNLKLREDILNYNKLNLRKINKKIRIQEKAYILIEKENKKALMEKNLNINSKFFEKKNELNFFINENKKRIKKKKNKRTYKIIQLKILGIN